MGGTKNLLNVGVNPKTLQDTVAAIPKGLGLGGAGQKTAKKSAKSKGKKRGVVKSRKGRGKFRK